MVTEAAKTKIDYDSKYAAKLKEAAEKWGHCLSISLWLIFPANYGYRKGASTVQDLKQKMKAEADRIRIERNKAAEKAAKEKQERLKATAAATASQPTQSTTAKRTPSQIAAEAKNPYDSSAPVWSCCWATVIYQSNSY